MSFITFPLASGFTGGGGGGPTVTLKTYSTTQGTITGVINGVNTVFVTATALDLTTGVVFKNGFIQTYGTDFTAAGTTITFTVAPANIVGANVLVHGEEV